MKLTYGLSSEGRPMHEEAQLVIAVEGTYSEVVQVLDGARLAYSEVEEEAAQESTRRLIESIGR